MSEATYKQRREAFIAGLTELTRRTKISIYGGSICGEDLMLLADRGGSSDADMARSYYRDGGDDEGLEFRYPACADFVEPTPPERPCPECGNPTTEFVLAESPRRLGWFCACGWRQEGGPPPWKPFNLRKALQAVREAGGSGWDRIDDPAAFLRGDAPAPPASASTTPLSRAAVLADLDEILAAPADADLRMRVSFLRAHILHTRTFDDGREAAPPTETAPATETQASSTPLDPDKVLSRLHWAIGRIASSDEPPSKDFAIRLVGGVADDVEAGVLDVEDAAAPAAEDEARDIRVDNRALAAGGSFGMALLAGASAGSLRVDGVEFTFRRLDAVRPRPGGPDG